MLLFTAFLSLILISYLRDSRMYREKKGESWAIDSVGLAFQGIIIPFLQITFAYLIFSRFMPGAGGTLRLSPPLAFLLNFVAVDYLYYWNHRLLHSPALWPWHALHHSAQRMDVLATSRNTIWTHFLIIYVWINGLLLYLLADKTYFALSVLLTAALDLWRHSEIFPPKESLAYRLISSFFITPHEHAWHHSGRLALKNYGANLNLWDRLHGTYESPADYPSDLDSRRKSVRWKHLFLPETGAGAS